MSSPWEENDDSDDDYDIRVSKRQKQDAVVKALALARSPLPVIQLVAGNKNRSSQLKQPDQQQTASNLHEELSTMKYNLVLFPRPQFSAKKMIMTTTDAPPEKDLSYKFMTCDFMVRGAYFSRFISDTDVVHMPVEFSNSGIEDFCTVEVVWCNDLVEMFERKCSMQSRDDSSLVQLTRFKCRVNDYWQVRGPFSEHDKPALEDFAHLQQAVHEHLLAISKHLKEKEQCDLVQCIRVKVPVVPRDFSTMPSDLIVTQMPDIEVVGENTLKQQLSRIIERAGTARVRIVHDGHNEVGNMRFDKLLTIFPDLQASLVLSFDRTISGRFDHDILLVKEELYTEILKHTTMSPEAARAYVKNLVLLDSREVIGDKHNYAPLVEAVRKAECRDKLLQWHSLLVSNGIEAHDVEPKSVPTLLQTLLDVTVPLSVYFGPVYSGPVPEITESIAPPAAVVQYTQMKSSFFKSTRFDMSANCVLRMNVDESGEYTISVSENTKSVLQKYLTAVCKRDNKLHLSPVFIMTQVGKSGLTPLMTSSVHKEGSQVTHLVFYVVPFTEASADELTKDILAGPCGEDEYTFILLLPEGVESTHGCAMVTKWLTVNNTTTLDMILLPDNWCSWVQHFSHTEDEYAATPMFSLGAMQRLMFRARKALPSSLRNVDKAIIAKATERLQGAQSKIDEPMKKFAWGEKIRNLTDRIGSCRVSVADLDLVIKAVSNDQSMSDTLKEVRRQVIVISQAAGVVAGCGSNTVGDVINDSDLLGLWAEKQCPMLVSSLMVTKIVTGQFTGKVALLRVDNIKMVCTK